jgi:hypothetical protein
MKHGSYPIYCCRGKNENMKKESRNEEYTGSPEKIDGNNNAKFY